MSSTGVNSDPDRMFKIKSFHRRNDSGELDVFEAARYFSGYNEAAAGYNNCATFSQKMMMREERQQPWRGGGRISLDVPTMRNTLPQQTSHHHHHNHNHHVVEKQNKEKKYKQPSSPGGRLASFLNSLFNQTGSKKKKSKSTTQSMKDEDESPGARRKRRSSISHFRSSSTADTKSFYSSSSSGFRTPPAAYAHNTPTKSYKDFRSYSDHKPVVSLSNYNTTTKSTASEFDRHHLSDHEKRNTASSDYSWLDDKFKFNDITGLSEKYKNNNNGKEMRKLNEVVDDDNGADSDSSSDLFELQNYDLGIYSSGLPVYETTHMDSIKRGAPITSGAL